MLNSLYGLQLYILGEKNPVLVVSTSVIYYIKIFSSLA